jgi:hypothetical protein
MMRADLTRTLAALGALCFGVARANRLKLISANPSDVITLYGRLDEEIWNYAGVVRLVQQSPYPGHATPYETEVRVLLAGARLYFGFICRDPDVRKISVHSMQRDDPMTGDDTVSIALDPYGDKRTGYFFRINAAGARADGLIAGPDEPSYDWDGVWDARTARLENGRSAEIVIPARTLSFTPGHTSGG